MKYRINPAASVCDVIKCASNRQTNTQMSEGHFYRPSSLHQVTKIDIIKFLPQEKIINLSYIEILSKVYMYTDEAGAN